jgi:hypothetical protein
MKANWKRIKERKQALIIANNNRENSKRLLHIYQKDWDSKYGSNTYKGPFEIVEVRSNGTVRIDEGRVTEPYYIRMITPYYRRYQLFGRYFGFIPTNHTFVQ